MSFEVGDLVLYRTQFPARVIATPKVPGPNSAKRNEHAKKYPKYAEVKTSASGHFYVIEFTTDKKPQNSKVMQSVMESDLTKQSGGKRKTRSKSKKTRKASRKQRKGTYRKRR